MLIHQTPASVGRLDEEKQTDNRQRGHEEPSHQPAGPTRTGESHPAGRRRDEVDRRVERPRPVLVHQGMRHAGRANGLRGLPPREIRRNQQHGSSKPKPQPQPTQGEPSGDDDGHDIGHDGRRQESDWKVHQKRVEVRHHPVRVPHARATRSATPSTRPRPRRSSRRCGTTYTGSECHTARSSSA